MNTKTIEIRDRATFIPALAIQLCPSCEADRYLLARAGFGRDPEDQAEYIMLVRLADGCGNHDPHQWGGRTMPVAHDFLVKNWGSVATGAVVDVEFILGETSEPKCSEAAGL